MRRINRMPRRLRRKRTNRPECSNPKERNVTYSNTDSGARKSEHDNGEAPQANRGNGTTAALRRLDRRAAKQLLDTLCGGDSSREPFAFQTFDDVKSRKNR